MNDLVELKNHMRKFSEVRDWAKFHSPKNLSMALSVEVAELTECFQWLTEEQSFELKQAQKEAVIDEIADVQLYLVRLADQLNIDIGAAVSQKIKKNELKYPADKVRGSSKKYSDYN